MLQELYTHIDKKDATERYMHMGITEKRCYREDTRIWIRETMLRERYTHLDKREDAAEKIQTHVNNREKMPQGR
jgi:hypothetical protein